MSLPEFDFHAPSQIDEVFQLKREYGAAARVMAGGTDLLMALKSGRIRCDHVIGLKGVADLNGLSYDDDTGLTIGANTVLASVSAFVPAREHYASLVSSIEVLATEQIRNKATVAGNLCNASPCADTAMTLMALGGRAVVIGPGSHREVPVESLIVGPRQLSLDELEIVQSVIVPPPLDNQRSMFVKHSRRSKVDIAAASVSIAVFLRDNVIEDVNIFLGSVAPRPMRAQNAESILKGKPLGDDLFRQAAQAARDECSPISDLRASAEHKRHMIGVMTRRILEQLTVQS